MFKILTILLALFRRGGTWITAINRGTRSGGQAELIGAR